MTHYYDVAVNFPHVHSILTYESQKHFNIGDLVEVPLGKRKEKGCIVKKKEPESTPEFEIKEILAPLNSLQVDTHLLSLLSWMSQYYHYGLGKTHF